MNKALFSGLLRAEAASNPMQTELTFVFTDFEGNKNKQGIPREESENIIRTGIFMPIKLSFMHDEPYRHETSLPIGFITDLELQEENERIVGKAIVWNYEFPDVVDKLKKASAETVQFSWEIFYKSYEKRDGIQWLRDCTVQAATIVSQPAYQGRTPMLAIAEDTSNEELAARLDSLKTYVHKIENVLHLRSSSMAETEQTEIEVNETPVDIAEVSDTEPSAQDEAITQPTDNESETSVEVSDAVTMHSLPVTEWEAFNDELNQLREYKNTIESEKLRAARLENRSQDLVAAGLKMTEDLKNLLNTKLVDLQDEEFSTYLSLVKAAGAGSSAQASTNDTRRGSNERSIVPDPTVVTNETVSIADLAKQLKTVGKRTKR